MPAFNTGNAAWDQGLGNLSGALFPDPSKVAQAGYYGAEQRKAQLESARLKEQFAAGHQQLGMVFGQAPGQPTYQTDPSTGQQILTDPAAAAPPPAPAAAAPAAAPPPPSLSGLVAGGGGGPAPGPAPAPGPTPAAAPVPGFQGGGEGGGAGNWVPQTTTPAAMSQVIAQAMDKASSSNVGPPLPPASPPAPSAPPAPNTTGTDGSTPAGEGAGPLHPGSLTPAGGGVKMSGPAASDGSPAPAAFNLAQYVALGVLHGLPAEQAIAQGRAVVAEWVKNGQMDQVTAEKVLSGLDRPEMRVAGIQGQTQRDVAGIQAGSAATVANIQAGSASAVERLKNEEADRARGDALVDTVDDQGNKTLISRRDLKPGQPGYDPTLANTRLSATVAPVTVQPSGPGTSSYSMPAGQAQRDKVPLYQAGTEDERQRQQGTSVTVQPGGPGTATYSEPTSTAQQNRSPLYQPTSADQFTAAQQQQIVNEKDPVKRQALIEGFTSAQTMAPKATDANESVRNSNIVNRQLQSQLPVPTIPLSQGGGMHTNTLPAGASPELETTLQNLTDQYFTYSPDKSIRGNRVGAADAAIQQLIRDKYIDPNQSRAGGWTPGSLTALTINKPVFNKDGSITQVPHFRVDIVDPKTGKPFPSGKAPTIPMAMSSVVTPAVADQQTTSSTAAPQVPPVPPVPVAPRPATPPAVTPPGAIAQAPPGTPDGKRAAVPGTNQVGVVRGGWVFAQ